MVAGFVIALLVGIAVQRLVELRIATRNREWALSQSATEHGAGHYPLFFVLHIGWLVAWPTEAFVRGPVLGAWWWLWLALFVAAQGLRYWCITSLGHYWNTRILVIPGHRLVQRGPYRYIPHPNYLAVAVELLSVPLIFGSWLTALVASLANAIILLAVRIPAETRALQNNQ